MKRGRSTAFVLIPGVLLLLSACANTPPLADGEELIRAGNYDQAVEFYMERLSESPQSVEIRIKLVQAIRAAADQHAKRGVALENTGRLDAALVEYRRALDYNAEQALAKQGADRVTARLRAQDLLSRGKDLLEKGQLQEATHVLSEATDLDPKNLQIQDVYEQATEQLKQAAEEAAREGELAATAKALSLLSTKPVTLRFKETDIKEVLEILSKLAEINILVDEGVRAKKVTSYIRDLSLRQAFNLILSTNRLFAKPINDNSLIVIPDTPAKHRQYDELQVRTFYLSNADAKRTVNMLRTILTTRQVFVDESLNAVTVRDTPQKIALAQKLIQLNDRGGGEVEIGLEILEVDRTKLRNMGITFTDQYQAAFFDIAGGTTTAGALAGASWLNDLIFTNPQIFLNLVKSDSEAKVLATPTLRVLNRQKARILIAERRPFAISSIETAPGGTGAEDAGATTTTESRVEYRDVGLTLTFTPVIHLNGEVTIELNFEFSVLGEDVGEDEFTPSVNTRNLDTFITLKDGESRLLGGLIQEERRKETNYSPGLGDLPLIGRLFRNEETQSVRRDLIISLNLRIVNRVEVPHRDVSTFWAGTGQSFEAGPTAPARAPARRPRRTPRPSQPGATPQSP